MNITSEKYDVVDMFVGEQRHAMSYFHVYKDSIIKQFVSKGSVYSMILIDHQIRKYLEIGNLSVIIHDHDKIKLKELLFKIHILSALACYVLEPDNNGQYSDISNIDIVEKIQQEGFQLFKRKNSDYGNSFASHGVIGIIIRMGDKISRIQSLEKKKRTEVIDESIRDTCIDLHNYAIMGTMLI